MHCDFKPRISFSSLNFLKSRLGLSKCFSSAIRTDTPNSICLKYIARGSLSILTPWESRSFFRQIGSSFRFFVDAETLQIFIAILRLVSCYIKNVRFSKRRMDLKFIFFPFKLVQKISWYMVAVRWDKLQGHA